MRLVLLINRNAGTFRRLPLGPTVDQAAEALRAGGHSVEVEIAGRRDLALSMSAAALRTDIDAVVAGGGDGTVLTAVLAGLGQEGKPLGLLPMGTLNLLARDIGLPLDPIEAARLLADPKVAAVDLGEVNGLPFTIWASLGMHPWVVRRRDRIQREEGFGKWPAFALAALRAFRRYPLVRATITVRGESTTVTTPVLIVSNNAWRQETLPPTRESLDQGELVVHVAKSTRRLSLLWLALNALIGRWHIPRLLATFSADEVRVTGRKRRMMLSLDGEVTVLRSPLVFRTRPRSLSMLVPRRPEEPG
ncbi:lipid kinase MamU [Magnetospirillum sp. UT-4]|uniref:lipid kinase MamU n=1 Tax=Magnetospirillum sp. UT-4 TaxID=2681467 RepID=UPI00157493B0|nr:lipid kinase MamU [Magnetospirillum sp. UT-4]